MGKKVQKVQYVQLGNTGFMDGMCKDMSLTKFKKQFTGILQGYDIEEAFVVLGGTIKKEEASK